MICAVIRGPTLQEASEQIAIAKPHAALFELRLDYFSTLDLTQLKEVCASLHKPWILTLRKSDQGGCYKKSETERYRQIEELLKLQPDYLDLELGTCRNFIQKTLLEHPRVKLMLSYHDFSNTPDEKALNTLYETLKAVPAYYYKLAFQALSSLDALRLLVWSKEKNDGRFIAISMGEHAVFSRPISSIIGCPIHYASAGALKENPLGQLTAQLSHERYHVPALSSKSSIYALIGDPIDGSMGDITHNAVFRSIGEDALYVKIRLKEDELEAFLELARMLPFKGISVTMPLKEKILSLLDECEKEAQKIGAVNTLSFCQGKISGKNTDGFGAINALEEYGPLQGKQIAILGAGGSARAIAYEALKRGAKVAILNRTTQRAIDLASSLNCYGCGLDEKIPYDILINTTPSNDPLGLPPLPNTLVMDIKSKTIDGPFLDHARKQGCRIVLGYRMFVEQALGQFDTWLPNRFSFQNGKELLEKTCRTILTLEN